MASGAKSFILNRKTDFTEQGVFRNLVFQNDEVFSDCEQAESSVFISKSFDTGINSTDWHRLLIDADFPEDCAFKIKIYCSDNKEIFMQSFEKDNSHKVEIDKFLDDETVNFNRKILLFKNIPCKTYENLKDVLLYGLKGRYMWFLFEINNIGTQPVCIKKIKFEFPKESFLKYFPDIYKTTSDNSGFFERFVGIFQSIYVDFEDQIDNISEHFAIEEMNENFLNWVVSWLKISDAKLWKNEKLRGLLRKIVKFYKIKGTKTSIIEIVNEFSNAKPIVVEQFELKKFDFFRKYRREIKKLFGETGRTFTVILDSNSVKSKEEYISILRIINSVKPIDAICNLVVLADRIYLGCHSYIGINSYITKNYDLVIDNSEKDINTLTLAK